MASSKHAASPRGQCYLNLGKSPDDLEILQFIEILKASDLPISTWIKKAAATGIRTLHKNGEIQKLPAGRVQALGREQPGKPADCKPFAVCKTADRRTAGCKPISGCKPFAGCKPEKTDIWTFHYRIPSQK
ncbi:hypothetical protein HER14_15635 [Acidithiobacillus thiooxidans]|uniref:hypothetical protein n=1 Tax=Acidithiobacillus thiooxidans TaxID=930 RepID=UPI001C06F2C1|nr:hypothetical protein [Acidithiobacillus thiooxidans]MBU2752323.1 hypothetical protein [Acidithiobacillus thiooxidans]